MNQQEPVQLEAQTAEEQPDPPVSQWVGRKVTEADVALYSGDTRDWFTREQRLAAFHKVENVHQAARRFGGCLCHFAGTGAVDWGGPTGITKTAAKV